MRIRRIEAATFDRMMPSMEEDPTDSSGTQVRVPKNHDNAMARAFERDFKAFDNIRRYSTPIERAYHKGIAELIKLQKERKKPEIGFVSQPAGSRAAALEAATPISAAPAPFVNDKPVINVLKDVPLPHYGKV
jgi:hypothetical protein